MHTMAFMATNPQGLFSTHQIATELKASEAHLSKVMQRLAKSELVRSIRGPHGGFTLARPPKETALVEVYEAIEGPFQPSHCLLAKTAVPGDRVCAGRVDRSINQQIHKYLAETTLDRLTNVWDGRNNVVNGNFA